MSQSTKSEYAKFLTHKQPLHVPCGIKSTDNLPDALKPFQRDIVAWSLRLGRAAIFAGTGLGKTLMQLSWADAIERHVGKPILIFTPLAVAQQTVREAVRFGIDGVAYASDQASATSRIVVTNYDRAEKFDLSNFGGVVLDESSIIKAHDSKTRALMMEICACVPYRLCCTATPAPNDYVELGNHAEFLGVLSAKEMLATWFVHEGSIRATNAGNHGSKPIAEWRLKRHAEKDFWRWVASWSVMIRHPRDLGYDEPGYDLPPLRKHQITVAVEHKANVDTGTLFAMEARTLQERRSASRASVQDRVDAAVKLIDAEPGEQWLIWCNLNDEADALVEGITGAIEVRGTDEPDDKASRMLAFSDGDIKYLVTKPKIAGFGMNWQRCSRIIFVGLNDSFEQVFQAVRRCWRFGQSKPVDVYMISAETEGAVVANLESKETAYEHMAAQMVEHMKDLNKRALRGREMRSVVSHNKQMELPSWM
jgi:hypothetical protein